MAGTINTIDTINTILPYSFNSNQQIANFNRQFVDDGHSVSATMQHTGLLKVRFIKKGDGYSLYVKNQNNKTLDFYDNYFGSNNYSTNVSSISNILILWVKKNDVITISSNVSSSSAMEYKYFIPSAILAYNSNYD